MAKQGTEKKKVWTVRASKEIASIKKELEASKDLLAEKELKISSQECELKDLREELEKKKEELFYVKKEKENLENWVAETNEFENIIMHEIRGIREVKLFIKYHNNYFHINILIFWGSFLLNIVLLIVSSIQQDLQFRDI